MRAILRAAKIVGCTIPTFIPKTDRAFSLHFSFSNPNPNTDLTKCLKES
jgi:hypothetical protein